MICPHCQRENRADRRFCGGCGTGLTITCASCAVVNDVIDRFCGGCGLATPALAIVVEASAGGVPMLSVSELESLLAEVANASEAPSVTLPQGPMGQDDLDRLFGGE